MRMWRGLFAMDDQVVVFILSVLQRLLAFEAVVEKAAAASDKSWATGRLYFFIDFNVGLAFSDCQASILLLRCSARCFVTAVFWLSPDCVLFSWFYVSVSRRNFQTVRKTIREAWTSRTCFFTFKKIFLRHSVFFYVCACNNKYWVREKFNN